MADWTRAERLEELRDRLHAEINDGHKAGCTCECGLSGDSRVLAALSKEYRATLAELETLGIGRPEEVSAVVDISARIARKLASAG